MPLLSPRNTLRCQKFLGILEWGCAIEENYDDERLNVELDGSMGLYFG
jgi:hypothetical protein